jgi:ribosome biogenesis GTPase / thiamine phosphate phosphatase
LRTVLAGRRWSPEGALANLEVQPVVGDWVLFRKIENQLGLPVIEQVLPRRSFLARGAAGRNGKGQVVAANIDWIAVVAAFSADEARESVQKRSLNPRRIERYLTAIRSGGARPLILLNKADLSAAGEGARAELETRLAGVQVLLVSTRSGAGRAALEALFGPRDTVGFVGLSGVGKSSLVNWLTGREAQSTQPERGHDGRGRHTTTHRELFATPSGVLVIDTPGMREFSLTDSDESDLSVFSDIETWAGACRFADCSHGEEPECRVRQAVRDGDLEADRLESYRTLREEIASKQKSNRERPKKRTKSSGPRELLGRRR